MRIICHTAKGACWVVEAIAGDKSIALGPVEFPLARKKHLGIVNINP